MATELRLRRGTTDEHSNFIGAEAEATVDTDKNTIVVHDGQNQGGFPLSREDSTDVSVNSVSELRTSSFPTNLERLHLSGYYGVGTPGGGELYRDSGDTTTADDGGIVFVDNDGVRWKRSNRQGKPFYPEEWGVHIDGTLTDNEFQSLVDAAQGQTIELRKGEINLSAFPNNFDNVSIEGSNKIVWSDVELGTRFGVHSQNKDVAIIAGVIRYYASGPRGAGWYFLEEQGQNHDPIFMDTVNASGSASVELNVNFEDYGYDIQNGWTPSTFVCGPDEELAQEGITVGASVGLDKVTIKIGDTKPKTNEILFSSSNNNFVVQSSVHTASFVDAGTSDARLQIVRDESFMRQTIFSSDRGGTYHPSITPRGRNDLPIYQPAARVVDSKTIDVFFFDYAGNHVKNPDFSMSVIISDPAIINSHFLDNWPDKYGNIWVIGVFTRKT